jgi:hypothetical protein
VAAGKPNQQIADELDVSPHALNKRGGTHIRDELGATTAPRYSSAPADSAHFRAATPSASLRFSVRTTGSASLAPKAATRRREEPTRAHTFV